MKIPLAVFYSFFVLLACANLQGSDSFSPISTDESNRLEFRGSTATTLKLQVVDEKKEPIDVTIQAFDCDRRVGWGRPSVCPLLIETDEHDEGVYTLKLPNIRGRVEIRIIKTELRVLNFALPNTYAATVDLGSLQFETTEKDVPTYDYQYREFKGQIFDEENIPIAGLLTTDIGNNKDRVPFAIDSSFEYTDSSGNLSVFLRGRDRSIYVETHIGRIELKRTLPRFVEPNEEEDYYFDYTNPELPRIVLDTEADTDIVVRGTQTNEVNFSLFEYYPYTEHSIPLSTLRQRFEVRPGRYSSRVSTPQWIRASTKGHLSRVLIYPDNEKPLVVDFSSDKRTQVRITSQGGPVNDANVSIIDSGAQYRHESVFPRKRNLEIDNFTTDRTGRLVILADPGSAYTALVTAEGFASRATPLQVGATNEIELTPANTRVKLKGFSQDESIRLKIGGTTTVAHFRGNPENEELTVLLAPGTYDATVENQAKETVRGTTFVVTNDPRDVDLSADNRPLLKIGLPVLPEISDRRRQRSSIKDETDTWNAVARREMPWGGVSGAAAMSYGSTTQTNPPEQIVWSEVSSSGTAMMRLPGTGRWFVHVGSRYGSIDYWLFTEVLAVSNETIELNVPPLTGSMTGVVQFDEGDGFFHHGIAGPRMMLLSDSGRLGEWNVVPRTSKVLGTGYFDEAETEMEGGFRLSNLPIGKYRIEHYLDENPGNRWGGTRVSLNADEEFNVGDLSSPELGPLAIEIVSRKGEPVSGVRLYIKNRMYDAWSSFAKLPTTGVYAAFPLEEPPVVPIIGRPVTIHGIQEGLLELMLEDGLGVKRYYMASVSNDRSIQLVVP